MGKSSFLSWLVASAEARDPPPPGGSHFVSLGLRDGEGSASPEAFLTAALTPVADAIFGEDAARGFVIPPGTNEAAPRAYAGFEAAVQRVAQNGGRLILLLDDFDRVTRSDRFPLQFFSFLRSLANNFPVAYVTTSRLDLQQLCALKEVEESPFFNIFQNVSLGPMDDSQIRALVEAKIAGAPVSPAGVASAGRWAAAQAGGLPAVAAACADLVAAGVAPDGDDAAAALDEAVAEYFQDLWEHLEPRHRALLERVAGGGAPGERDARPLRDLGPRRGYLREIETGWTVASPAFARFLTARRGGSTAPGLLTRVRRLFGGGEGR